MANNITITEGTGKTIATDEAGGAHYQMVKLVSGTEDATDRIGGDATNGLDVDVTRVIPGTSATHLGKAEDAVHASGDTGVMALAVRNDTLAALGSSDGDYAPLQVDANGALFVNTSTLTARDRTTDNVGVAIQTDVIANDTAMLTPKYAVIDDATSGDNELVAAVANKKIRVLSLMLMAAGTVTARFESSTAGNFLSGEMNLVANVGFALGFNPVGWFETVAGESLNMQLSAAISTDGFLTYIEV